jgi:hypothetical protein
MTAIVGKNPIKNQCTIARGIISHVKRRAIEMATQKRRFGTLAKRVVFTEYNIVRQFRGDK